MAMDRHAYLQMMLLSIIAVACVGILFPVKADAVVFARSLEAGMRGDDVATLQTFLATDASLYPEKLVTGYFGPLTRAAVTRFQAREGIAQVGRMGLITMARLNGLPAVAALPAVTGFGIGGSDDVNAPVMTAAQVSTSSSAVSIAWTTSEPAWSRVMYSTVWPFAYATAQNVADATFDMVTTISIPGLSANTTYYFVRESVDVAGNMMWTTAQSFRTNP